MKMRSVEEKKESTTQTVEWVLRALLNYSISEEINRFSRALCAGGFVRSLIAVKIGKQHARGFLVVH